MALPSPRGADGLILTSELHEEHEVRLFRHQLRHALDATTPAFEQAEDFVVAVNEAVTNVFRHAYDGGTRGSCRVKVARQPDAIVAIVEDDGRGFDPGLAFDFAPLDESGRGFPIIRSLVDDLTCDVTDSGTHVKLRLALR